MTEDSKEKNYHKKIEMMYDVDSSVKDSKTSDIPLVLLQHDREASLTYEGPLAVQINGPTSQFFLHEVLEPKYQPAQELDADTFKYYSFNNHGLPSSSAPIVFPSHTTPSPSIIFPDELSSPASVPDTNAVTPVPTETPSGQTVTNPPNANETDTRVIISVPCRGPCQVSAGRVCVTDFSCRGNHPVK